MSEILNKRENNISVDLILVNSVPFTEVLVILNKYSHKNILFDSRIREKISNFKRFDTKQSHSIVGGSTDSVISYTLFTSNEKFKLKWIGFKPRDTPHTDILLHINSAAGVSRLHTKKYAMKGFKPLTAAQNLVPQVIKLKDKGYHPSGLFPTTAIKPKFVLPCVFSATGFVQRCATLTEKCSMWDISTTII